MRLAFNSRVRDKRWRFGIVDSVWHDVDGLLVDVAFVGPHKGDTETFREHELEPAPGCAQPGRVVKDWTTGRKGRVERVLSHAVAEVKWHDVRGTSRIDPALLRAAAFPRKTIEAPT